MRRGRLLVSAGACALVALGAVTAPAVSAEPSAAPDTSSAERAVGSDGMVAAMRRDLGLTEAQAVARMRQEATAMRIDPAAKAAAGADYGGSWFDAKRGTLVVGLTDADRADEVRATGAEVATVEHTLASLDAAKARLDRGKAPASVASWRVDPMAGGLVVSVVRGSTDRADVQ
ncbi:MAG TPA: alpha-lytic protease prodomain-containing protein, partial [Actinophytocola sp.]|nr:alpha-lytic protease prodomain-containing protein [Actinophytocola sp.]